MVHVDVCLLHATLTRTCTVNARTSVLLACVLVDVLVMYEYMYMYLGYM